MKRYDLIVIEEYDPSFNVIKEVENGKYIKYSDVEEFIEGVEIYLEHFNKYGDACITILQDAMRKLNK